MESGNHSSKDQYLNSSSSVKHTDKHNKSSILLRKPEQIDQQVNVEIILDQFQSQCIGLRQMEIERKKEICNFHLLKQKLQILDSEYHIQTFQYHKDKLNYMQQIQQMMKNGLIFIEQQLNKKQNLEKIIKEIKLTKHPEVIQLVIKQTEQSPTKKMLTDTKDKFYKHLQYLQYHIELGSTWLKQNQKNKIDQDNLQLASLKRISFSSLLDLHKEQKKIKKIKNHLLTAKKYYKDQLFQLHFHQMNSFDSGVSHLSMSKNKSKLMVKNNSRNYKDKRKEKVCKSLELWQKNRQQKIDPNNQNNEAARRRIWSFRQSMYQSLNLQSSQKSKKKGHFSLRSSWFSRKMRKIKNQISEDNSLKQFRYRDQE